MSKAKPWPTVANRHRVDAIMKAGEVKRAAGEIVLHIQQLREAARGSNIALILAIASAIEGRVLFVQEASATVITTLENAPADDAPGSNGAAGGEA